MIDIDRARQVIEAERCEKVFIADHWGGWCETHGCDWRKGDTCVMRPGVADVAADLLAAVERVRVATSNHPDPCDRHDDADPISCGWRNAYEDVCRALNGDTNA